MNIIKYLEVKWRLIALFVVLTIASIFFSIKCETMGTIISAIGSIVSVCAIIHALVKFQSVETQTKEINAALNANLAALNKKETTELVNKYVEVIGRIQHFITLRHADAAVLKIEELQVFLQNILCNPTVQDDVKATIRKQYRKLSSDATLLRQKSPNDPFPQDADCMELSKHFEALRDTLIYLSQNIHFSND